jgi:hypothetical protein
MTDVVTLGASIATTPVSSLVSGDRSSHKYSTSVDQPPALDGSLTAEALDPIATPEQLPRDSATAGHASTLPEDMDTRIHEAARALQGQMDSDHFTIQEVLGKGGCGTVYRGTFPLSRYASRSRSLGMLQVLQDDVCTL